MDPMSARAHANGRPVGASCFVPVRFCDRFRLRILRIISPAWRAGTCPRTPCVALNISGGRSEFLERCRDFHCDIHWRVDGYPDATCEEHGTAFGVWHGGSVRGWSNGQISFAAPLFSDSG